MSKNCFFSYSCFAWYRRWCGTVRGVVSNMGCAKVFQAVHEYLMFFLHKITLIILFSFTYRVWFINSCISVCSFEQINCLLVIASVLVPCIGCLFGSTAIAAILFSDWLMNNELRIV